MNIWVSCCDILLQKVIAFLTPHAVPLKALKIIVSEFLYTFELTALLLERFHLSLLSDTLTNGRVALHDAPHDAKKGSLRVACYRVAKTHRMPYLCMAFPAKEP